MERQEREKRRKRRNVDAKKEGNFDGTCTHTHTIFLFLIRNFFYDRSVLLLTFALNTGHFFFLGNSRNLRRCGSFGEKRYSSLLEYLYTRIFQRSFFSLTRILVKTRRESFLSSNERQRTEKSKLCRTREEKQDHCVS